MPNTLYSIYTAQRALAVNQAAIDVINSNIANMNTKGYSKQRIEISQLSSASRYANPLDMAQENMGAIVDAVTRNRDVFLDNTFRQATTDVNYYKEYSDIAVQLENVVDELGDTGLNKALNDFYNGLSQLAANPNDYVIRSNLVQNAVVLAEKFNDMYSDLQTARTNLVGDINNPSTLNESKLYLTAEDLNDKLNAVADLNHKINLSSSQGITPNSLLDKRDLLLDEISEYLPVNIKNESNNTTTISLGNVQLVSGGKRKGFFTVQMGDSNNPSILRIKNEAGSILSNNVYSSVTSGKIGAILHAGGSDSDKLTINGQITSLNTLAVEFTTAINDVQTNGKYIDGNTSPHELSNNNPVNFFVDSDSSGIITAGNIAVDADILNDPYRIAAADLLADFDETGNGANALLMSQIRDMNITGLGSTSTSQYLVNLTGQLGIKSRNIQSNYEVKDNVLQYINQKRESVIGVNLDEELTDLIRFQKAYEASAKVLSAITKNLSIIMNMIS